MTLKKLVIILKVLLLPTDVFSQPKPQETKHTGMGSTAIPSHDSQKPPLNQAAPKPTKVPPTTSSQPVGDKPSNTRESVNLSGAPLNQATPKPTKVPVTTSPQLTSGQKNTSAKSSKNIAGEPPPPPEEVPPPPPPPATPVPPPPTQWSIKFRTWALPNGGILIPWSWGPHNGGLKYDQWLLLI